MARRKCSNEAFDLFEGWVVNEATDAAQGKS